MESHKGKYRLREALKAAFEITLIIGTAARAPQINVKNLSSFPWCCIQFQRCVTAS